MLESMGRHGTCETSVAVTVPAAAHGEKTGAAAAYHEPGQASYRRLVLALSAAGVTTFAVLYSTQPLLGVLAQRFAIPVSRAAWSVSAATVLLGIGMVMSGPLSNRYGRVRVINGSLVVTAALGAIGGMTGRLLAGGVADLARWRWALAAVAVLSGLCAVEVIKWPPASRHHNPLERQRSGRTVTRAGTTTLPAWRLSARATARVLGDSLLRRLDVVAFVAMGAFVAVCNVLGFRLANGWAAAVGQRRHHAGSEASTCCLLAYYIGSSVFGVAGTALWASGRWPAVAGLAAILLLIPAVLAVRLSAAAHS
jgi:MFS transporter, YNFM family, putative membrane transport protein